MTFGRPSIRPILAAYLIFLARTDLSQDTTPAITSIPTETGLQKKIPQSQSSVLAPHYEAPRSKKPACSLRLLVVLTYFDRTQGNFTSEGCRNRPLLTSFSINVKHMRWSAAVPQVVERSYSTCPSLQLLHACHISLTSNSPADASQLPSTTCMALQAASRPSPSHAGGLLGL